MNELDDSVLVALGSSLKGDFESSSDLLDAALDAFPGLGLILKRHSRWWRSASWPDSALPDYMNGLAIVETTLGPCETLSRLHALEVRFGRVRDGRNGPRTLDLDLIAHGRTVLEAGDLILPHPRAAERLFVMGPLAEIAPGWRHPVSGLTAKALIARATVGLDAHPC
jgi:2-amino-4-hydroxy-6-hydroxymethyldihydropteridine diphosphokinase